MRHCKPVHQSQSQNCAIFTSNIWSILWKTNILFPPLKFRAKYLRLPVLTIYFVKKNCLCPEKGLHFRYFNLTLGHFYTFNAWNSQKRAFTHSCRYSKYLSFATLVTMKQKLVQRCETEIVADASNASCVGSGLNLVVPGKLIISLIWSGRVRYIPLRYRSK